MIQKSYSKFFVESPSVLLQTSETTSPNASQTAIDHHPLTLCLCISENSTTTTISIEGPDPVDAKSLRILVLTQLSSGTAIFQYLSEGDPGTKKKPELSLHLGTKFHQCFRKLDFPWKFSSNFPWWENLPAACLAGGRIPAVAATRHSCAFTSMTQVSDNMWPLVRSLPHQWIQRMRLDAHICTIYIYTESYIYIIYMYIICKYSLAFSSSTFKVTIYNFTELFVYTIHLFLSSKRSCLSKKKGKHPTPHLQRWQGPWMYQRLHDDPWVSTIWRRKIGHVLCWFSDSYP